MSKQKLVCTAELDLPEDSLEAVKAQAALLEVWAQFKDAVPDGTVLTEHVVKAKPKTPAAPKPQDAPASSDRKR
jgi:hypothetical protein